MTMSPNDIVLEELAETYHNWKASNRRQWIESQSSPLIGRALKFAHGLIACLASRAWRQLVDLCEALTTSGHQLSRHSSSWEAFLQTWISVQREALLLLSLVFQ